MQEQEQYSLASMTAETMSNLWELEQQQRELDLEGMMRRFKDLSAYSLTHAEILNQREGVELLALGMFFGASSKPQFHKNQARLSRLSAETLTYEGRSELIEEEVAGRDRDGSKAGKREGENDRTQQRRLL